MVDDNEKSEVAERREVARQIGWKMSACSGVQETYQVTSSQSRRVDDVLNQELSAAS
jgi:hypothetical protein